MNRSNQGKVFRYALFGLLYFVQGAVLSYFTALNALYLLSFDLTMSQIGIFSAIAFVPFVLKIFLGMVSDRVNLLGMGHRKPYIVLGLFLQAACLFIAPLLDPSEQFWVFTALSFLAIVGMALYDTCTDGLALDTTPKEEEGSIQSVMVAGRAMGLVVVSAALGLLAQLTSWRMAFWALSVVTAVPLVLVAQIREGPRTNESTFQWRAFASFKSWPVFKLGLLGALYSFVIYSASEIVNPFLKETYGIGTIAAGLYTAVWGLGVIFGGLTGGRVTDRLGQRWALIGAMATSTVSILLLAAISSPGMAWPIVALFGLAFGYYETVYFAMAMDRADRRIAASMFAILMAVANIGTGIGFAVAGQLVDRAGYSDTFIIIAICNILVLPLVRSTARGGAS